MPRWNDTLSTNTTIHHSTNTATADACIDRISVQQSKCIASNQALLINLCGRKKEPGTHSLRMLQIAPEFRRDRKTIVHVCNTRYEILRHRLLLLWISLQNKFLFSLLKVLLTTLVILYRQVVVSDECRHYVQ